MNLLYSWNLNRLKKLKGGVQIKCLLVIICLLWPATDYCAGFHAILTSVSDYILSLAQ